MAKPIQIDATPIEAAIKEMRRLKTEQGRAYIDHIRELIEIRDDLKGELEALRDAGQPGGIRYDKPAVRNGAGPNIWAVFDAAVNDIENKDDLEERLSNIEAELKDARQRTYKLETAEATYLRMNLWMRMSVRAIATYLGRPSSTVQDGIQRAYADLYDAGLPMQWRVPAQPAI